jgi:hypothetical protein
MDYDMTEMTKKIAVLGKGTVGCLSSAILLGRTDFEIDLIYDPETPAVSVGEGSTLTIPSILQQYLGWDNSYLQDISATLKHGIYKENWGKVNDSYYHSFPCGLSGLHFSAHDFHQKMLDSLVKNPRINLIEKRIDDPFNIDSDFVFDCTGTPSNIETEEFNIRESIPVNAAYVVQCDWEYPKFVDSLTIARPYGWVFGIPLKNRCSIGYVYNSNINSLEEVKQDIQTVLEKYDLVCNGTTNNLNFTNYSRKKNYISENKIAYNGNASFFLEPLEATSTTNASNVAMDLADSLMVDFCNFSMDHLNDKYEKMISSTESMICLHYYAGSKFDTEFWQHAKELAEKTVMANFSEWGFTEFGSFLESSLYNPLPISSGSVGTWSIWSYATNLKMLGLYDNMRKICNVQQQES